MEKLYVITGYILDHYVTDHIAELIRTSNGQDIGHRVNVEPLDYPKYNRISMDEQCKNLGMNVYDISIPHNFVIDCIKTTGQSPVGRVVMCYDENKGFGELKGIDREGELILKIYHHIKKEGK